MDDDAVLLPLKLITKSPQTQKTHVLVGYFDLFLHDVRTTHPMLSQPCGFQRVVAVPGQSFVYIGNAFKAACVVDFGSLLSTQGSCSHNLILDE